eukprot:gb/GECH01008088.1/.p1 GENE.gb/GECH01008088.1/~~gb/GECH01008088.1/.p1  ORF type:complete len:297 (+),score=101.69 gb/GECH01008088.1/:1-891(+)
MAIVREASHAGSWYSGDGKKLNSQLKQWISEASKQEQINSVRAVIGPHAGYRFCGPTAGHAYTYVNPDQIKRVFILGPSHRVYIRGCAFSPAQKYQTPIADLPVDRSTLEEFRKSAEKTKHAHVDDFALEDDENEHSIEMHLPWIASIFGSIPIVPIVVGDLSSSSAQALGQILAPYLQDPSVFVVVSSDFCHWGSRFRYMRYNSEDGPIYQSIEKLDRQGMEAISTLDSKRYQEYQEQTKNTICGRNPIRVLMNAVETIGRDNFKMDFVHYSQSNQVKSKVDSSVSYGAGVLYQQ